MSASLPPAPGGAPGAGPVRPKLLEYIVCPACRGRLAPLGDDLLVCRHAACRRAYGLIHGRIPDLVLEDARILDEEDWSARLVAAGLPPRAPEDRRPDRRRPRRRRERPDAGGAAADVPRAREEGDAPGPGGAGPIDADEEDAAPRDGDD